MAAISHSAGMQSDVARALKEMRDEAGMSVRELARALDMPHTTYSAYEDKYKRDELPVWLVKKLVSIFEKRGIHSEKIWALAGLDDTTPIFRSSSPNPEDADITAMARVEEFDVRAGMGAGMFMGEDEATSSAVHEWQLPRDLIRSATYSPVERVKIITVVGDSMEGTFRPYERVMVDTQDCSPSPPGIFVVYDGLGLVVKRVEYVPHSDPPTVRIMSDNPRFSPYERVLGEAYIQGRVLGRWQWV